MEKTRPKLKVERPRCPYCHDEIQPGGENRPCKDCLTWHHEECWDSHGQCVSCGNSWVDRGGGVESSPVPRYWDLDTDCDPDKDDCFVHDRMNERARQDLVDLHGAEAANRMFAEMCKRGPKAKGLSKEYWDKQGCQHKWGPDHLHCLKCDADMEEVHGEAYVNSFIDKELDDEFLDEAIVCMSHRCDEPTSRREGGICGLCLAEVDVLGESRPEGATTEQRRAWLDEYRRLNETSLPDTPPTWMMAVLFISIVTFVIYMVGFRA